MTFSSYSPSQAAAELSKQAEKRKNKEEESGDERPGLSSRASAEKEGGEEEMQKRSRTPAVNHEWEFLHRHGFCCQFSKGIFQLWFHFKRFRYRR
ncbi:cactin [Tachysurus ichikawai]